MPFLQAIHIQVFQRGRHFEAFNKTAQTNNGTKRHLLKQEFLQDEDYHPGQTRWETRNVIALTKHFQPNLFNASELPKKTAV